MHGWISAALIQGIRPATADVLVVDVVVAVPCGQKRHTRAELVRVEN
jgi:hypothetical protein